jgi:two-component system LytT family response regulator
MIARLGHLLRTVLGASGEHEVPLARELDLAEQYLELHRLRFGDRLSDAAARDGAPGATQATLAALLSALTSAAQGPPPRIPLRIVGPAGRVLLVRPAEIDRAESDGNHVRVHVGRETHTVREPLADLEARLPAGQFARVSRSALVNLDRVREVQPWFRGDYVVILADGTRVTTGKTYRERVRMLFGL